MILHHVRTGSLWNSQVFSSYSGYPWPCTREGLKPSRRVGAYRSRPRLARPRFPWQSEAQARSGAP